MQIHKRHVQIHQKSPIRSFCLLDESLKKSNILLKHFKKN